MARQRTRQTSANRSAKGEPGPASGNTAASGIVPAQPILRLQRILTADPELSERRAKTKTMKSKTTKHTATARPDRGLRMVGQSYVFMRDNHDWHTCEVSVIAIKGKRFTVARCCNIADAILAPGGSPKRKIKTWTCTEDELW